MRTQQNVLYQLAHPEFFEAVDRYRPESRHYLDDLRGLLPGGWRVTCAAPWCHCAPPDDRLPAQGWKIHLSATVDDSRGVLFAALPVLTSRNVPFKLALDGRILGLMNGKQWSRGRSGKFMTIYPRGDEEFLDLLARLDEATAPFAGPYILSDRRYRDSRVVYYRYGTIRSPLSVDVTGQRTSFLIAPDGTRVLDARAPSFRIPAWVSDPVKPLAAPARARVGLKNGRYRVTSVLGFTNAGGIYLAEDTVLSRTVVLKEARPRVGAGAPAGDAVALLTREYRMLTEIADLDIGPRPYELFTEWEHTFLVEERLAGAVLRMHAIRGFPLFRADPPAGELEAFRANALAIFETLAAKLARLHSHGIVFADLSPSNVIVLDGSLDLRLVDFEAAFHVEDRAAPNLFTPGFAPRGAGTAEPPSRERDLYALGAVMLSYLFPIASFFDLKPDGRHEWLASLARDLRLPEVLSSAIAALIVDEPAARPRAAEIAARFRELRRKRGARSHTDRADENRSATAQGSTPTESAAYGLAERLGAERIAAESLARRAAAYVDGLADPARTDRLWPADPAVFHTNPLNVAYGACGIAIVLQRIAGTCPSYALDWIERQPLSTDTYPPGLYVGLSGIAWSLLELGRPDQAGRALALAGRHTLLWDSPDVYFGAAGWGMANLKFFAATGDERYLQRARDTGERLLQQSRVEQDACCWQSIDRTYFGLAHGASGVALFFLYLHLASREERWFEMGRRALEFDLAHGVPGRLGGLAWPYHTTQPNPLLPYWKYGSAGIGAVLLRYLRVERTPHWQACLDGIVEFVESKYAVSVGQCMGLAGIGGFLIDAWQFTADDAYLARAARTLAGLRLFAIEKGRHVAFPGDALGRISCDYSTGTAGVALFLWRMAHGGPAAFMLDELFEGKAV